MEKFTDFIKNKLNKKSKILITCVGLIISLIIFLLLDTNSRVLAEYYQGTLSSNSTPTYLKFDDDTMYVSIDGDSIFLFDKISEEEGHDEEVDMKSKTIFYRLNKAETKKLVSGGDTSEYDALFAIVNILNDDYSEIGFSLNIHSPSMQDALLDPLIIGRVSKNKNQELPEIRNKDAETLKREREQAAKEAAKKQAEVANAASAVVAAKAEAERKASEETKAQEELLINQLYSNLVEQKLLPQYSETYSIDLEVTKGDLNSYQDAFSVSRSSSQAQTFSDNLIGEKVFINGYIIDGIYLDNEQVWILKLNVMGTRVFAMIPYITNNTNKELEINDTLVLYGIYKGKKTLNLNNSGALDLPFFEGRLIVPWEH